MSRNCTYLFCCLVLLFGRMILTAQDSNSCLSFQLEDVHANSAGEFCIDLKTQGFQNVLGMQGSILYDPNVLQFTRTKDYSLAGLSTASFGTPTVGPEKTVTFSWSSPTATGVDLVDGQVMAKLCFQPLVDSGKTIVEFSKDPTPIELIDGNLHLLSATFLAAEVRFGDAASSDISIDELCVGPSICGEIGRGFIDIVASSDAQPLSYSWTGPNGFSTNASSFEALSGGYFDLEISNSEGEMTKACAVVTGGTGQSIVAANITPVPCDQEDGGAIELSLTNASAELEFVWSNGATARSLSNLSPGNYIVTITDDVTGCSVTESFNVPQEVLRGGLFSNCLNENEVELWALIFDVEGNPHSYEWSNGETFTGPNEHKITVPAVAGTAYQVTVTNNQGCSRVLQATIPSCEIPTQEQETFDGCLLLEAEHVQAEQGEIVCLDFTVQDFRNILGLQLTVQFDQDLLGFIEARDFALASSTTAFGVLPEFLADGQVTLAWSDAQLSPRTLVDNEVVFSLCFEVLGDTGFASVIVDGSRTPMEAVWASNLSLDLQPIPLGSIGGGIQIGESTSPKPVIDQICAETLGCGSSATINLVAAVSGDAGPFSYAWAGPEGYTSFEQASEVMLPGLYSLTVTDQAGRTALAAIQVEENADPINIDANITEVSCDGSQAGSISLTDIPADADYSYIWSNGAATKDISGLAVGEYTVTISDQASGCQSTKRFDVDLESIVSFLSWSCRDTSSVEMQAFAFSTGLDSTPYTFTWSTGEVEVAEEVSSVIAPLDVLTSVTITNARGCVSEIGSVPYCPDREIFASISYNCQTEDQTVTLRATVWEDDNGPYLFNWSNGIAETGTEGPDVTTSSIVVAPGNIYHVTITDVSGNTKVIGDIKPNCTSFNSPTPQLSIGEANAETGETVCLAVRAKDFVNLLGLQYAVSWDPTQLELNNLQNFALPDLDETNFNLGGNNYQNGLLRFLWIDRLGLGISIPDDQVLYEMCFKVLGEGGEAPVFFDVASMQTEVVNNTPESTSPILDDGLIIINGEERMWPGDTDHNEVANHFDLLNLGLAYGATGPIRENANLIWRGQWATDWEQVTPSTGVDYKHIDTNGDGIINTADTTAISLNWGRAVNLSPNPTAEYRSSPEDMEMQGAPIYVQAYSVRPGETVSFDINLGDSENPVEGAYGLAFSIVYDPLAVVYGSATATFQDSWLGTLGQDMIALVRDDPNNHRLHIGITRIDQLEVNGSGSIGQISMTIEDVIFRDGEHEMPFRIENIRLIRATEAEIELTQKQTLATVTDTPLSLGEEPMQEQVKLFPNPTVDLINIEYQAVKIDRVQILDLGGQLLVEYKAMNQISLQGLTPSTYVLRFIGPDGVFLKKVIKQ